MFSMRKVVGANAMRAVRRLSDAPKAVTPAVPAAAKAAAPSGGSTFLQRFSSFLAGCGVGFGVSFYFIYTELVDSNENLLRNIKQIEGYKGN
jgi:hypothetical protein